MVMPSASQYQSPSRPDTDAGAYGTGSQRVLDACTRTSTTTSLTGVSSCRPGARAMAFRVFRSSGRMRSGAQVRPVKRDRVASLK